MCFPTSSDHVTGHHHTKDARDVLLLRLRSLRISPCNLFEVSNSDLLGTFATIATYLIVLLQFRASNPNEKEEEENS